MIASLLDQLPHWNHMTDIPVMEVRGMTWRDEPRLVSVRSPYKGGRPVLMWHVGDAVHFKARMQAKNDIRHVVRIGMADVLDWLAESGDRVWI